MGAKGREKEKAKATPSSTMSLSRIRLQLFFCHPLSVRPFSPRPPPKLNHSAQKLVSTTIMDGFVNTLSELAWKLSSQVKKEADASPKIVINKMPFRYLNHRCILVCWNFLFV